MFGYRSWKKMYLKKDAEFLKLYGIAEEFQSKAKELKKERDALLEKMRQDEKGERWSKLHIGKKDGKLYLVIRTLGASELEYYVYPPEPYNTKDFPWIVYFWIGLRPDHLKMLPFDYRQPNRSFSRNGIGKLLMTDAIELLTFRGFHGLSASMEGDPPGSDHRVAMEGFYAKCGFTIEPDGKVTRILNPQGNLHEGLR